MTVKELMKKLLIILALAKIFVRTTEFPALSVLTNFGRVSKYCMFNIRL